MDTIKIDIPYEKRASRIKLFTRFFWILILAWPIYFWVIFIWFVQIALWCAILFTGRFNPTLWNLNKKFFLYVTRLNAWMTLLTDRRPYLFKEGDSGPTQKKTEKVASKSGK